MHPQDNVAAVLDGLAIGQAGVELATLVERVVNGEQTMAEKNRQDLLALFTTGRPL